VLTIEQQIFKQIKKANKILITFNKIWNGDAISSALVFYLFLQKINKQVEIASDKFYENNLYSFLPSYNKIKLNFNNPRQFIISFSTDQIEVDQIRINKQNNQANIIISTKYGNLQKQDLNFQSQGFDYDLIIAVDTPDLQSLGKVYENNYDFFYQTPIINIDHNPENEAFGKINFIELTAISTTEIIFSLLESYSKEIIDEDLATCLLTGLISKTKNFRTTNITPHSLMITSELINLKARREEIVNKLYRSRSLHVLKLWGRILARLKSDLNEKLIWTELNQVDFFKTNTSEQDLNDVIDELIINIPQAELVLIIMEMNNQKEQKQTQILAYAMKNINCLELFKDYKPQGSKKLAKIILNKNIKEIEQDFIPILSNQLKNLL